jgi:hypothetical protein
MNQIHIGSFLRLLMIERDIMRRDLYLNYSDDDDDDDDDDGSSETILRKRNPRFPQV